MEVKLRDTARVNGKWEIGRGSEDFPSSPLAKVVE